MARPTEGSVMGRLSNIELTQDERAVVTSASQTWGFVRKTLDNWITIGKGIAVLRAKANRTGGRDTFAELMEANGFGELTTSRTKWLPSLLLKIVDPENLPRVQAWHSALLLHQQLAWASPRSIIRHAKDQHGQPIFPPKSGVKPAQPRRVPKMHVEHAIDAIVDYCSNEKLAPDERMQIMDRLGVPALPFDLLRDNVFGLGRKIVAYLKDDERARNLGCAILDALDGSLVTEMGKRFTAKRTKAKR